MILLHVIWKFRHYRRHELQQRLCVIR